MATSRNVPPALPTISATTRDLSRGGPFHRPSDVNIVSGTEAAELVGINVNDSTITLAITVDGVTETQSFMLNQENDASLNYTFTSMGGGGTSPTQDTHVNTVSFDAQSGELTLALTDGTTRSTTLPIGGVTRETVEQLIAAAIAALPPVSEAFTDLTDTPNTLGNPGQEIRVNSAGTGFEFYTPSQSGVTADEFASPTGTVAVADTAAGDVSLDASLIAIPNMQVGGITTNTNFYELAVSSDLRGPNNRPLTFAFANNRLTLQEAGPGTPPPTAPTEEDRVPPPSSFFDAPMDETITIDIMNGSVPTGMDPTSTATNPAGDPITITPMVTNPERTRVEVTIPAAEGGDPGDYTVMTMVPVQDSDGTITTLDVTDTVTRFIPYVEFRGTQPTTAADITGSSGTISTSEWVLPVTVASPDTGSLYIAVEDTLIPDMISNMLVEVNGNQARPRVGVVGDLIPVTTAGTTVMYQVIRFGGNIPTGTRLLSF